MMKTVFDVGMFNGSDTKYYAELGFRVIAVEANPTLAERARKRLADHIAAGNVEIVQAAIADRPGSITLHLSGDDLGSSSTSEQRVTSINPVGSFEVQAITYPNLVSRYGTPHFLKVDIEGADRHCVLALTPETRPEFLSFEIGADVDELMAHVIRIGFDRFKIINQSNFRDIRNENCLHERLARRTMYWLGYAHPTRTRRAGRFFSSGSSGPVPWLSDGTWLDANRVRALWRDYVARGRDTAWYDIHATRAA